MQRCKWTNLEKHEIYMEYHDNEWGIPSYNDRYLFEMLVLELFHCGLSWLIMLKKRDAFRIAFDDFNPYIIKNYDENKMNQLLENKGIIRNKSKIKATIHNALCFIEVQKEFGSFSSYIWSFTDNKVVYSKNDILLAQNELSDIVSKDLKKRGFQYMGSVTTYSYLEAIGVMNNHCSYCFKSHKQHKQVLE